MPELLSPPSRPSGPSPTRLPLRLPPDCPPPRRRRSDDPDPETERDVWLPPIIAAMFLAACALATVLLVDVLPPSTRSALLLVGAAALNIAIVWPLVHLIVEQRRALRGPERRRGY